MFDENKDQLIYDAWKPLRNGLRMYDLHDSLAVIRWYFVRRHSPRSFPTPTDLEPHPWTDRQNCFLPFEMETLAREVIISSSLLVNPRYTMRRAHDISLVINKMKDIDGKISEAYIDHSNVYQELTTRIAHRQFKYQTERPNITNLVRYSKIFSRDTIDRYVKSEIGLTTKQIYTIGSALWFHLEENFSLTIDGLLNQLPGITNNDVNLFISHFAKPLIDMKAILSNRAEHQINDKFFYAYNSMYKYPLMTTTHQRERVLVCPLPTLLVWRFTSGLYYDLVHINTFGNEFGLSYEHYVGEMLSATMQHTNRMIYAGEPNLPNSPRRCDWIIETPDDVLFIETKTKRLSMAARTEIVTTETLHEQLEILAGAIFQVYQSLIAYQHNEYTNPSYSLPPAKSAYVAVVTLEEWYLMGDQTIKLNELVKEKLIKANIPIAIMSRSPYCILSSDDIERFSYLAKTMPISEIILPYIEGWRTRYSGHEFGNYMDNRFKKSFEAYEYIFRDNDNIFTSPVHAQ